MGSAGALAGEVSGSSGMLGLGTAVNGMVGGSCTAGLCQVSGGTAAGSNLFHRFSAFDTRGGISGVNVNTGGIPNVFMAVINPAGSFIDRQVNFSGPTNLVWLSPGGISVSGAGGFTNVPQLNLSTATGWRLGNGVFEAAATTAGQAALLSGAPFHGLAGAVNNPDALAALGLQKNGDLTLAAGLITVEKELLLDAQGGNVLLQAVSVQAPGGQIALSGANLALKDSNLDVSAGGGGGSVNVGGALKGGDGSRPNTATTLVDAASSIRADATQQGRGGTVVVWADGIIRVDGEISARGGPQGGDGGFIETSGKQQLSVSRAADAGAPQGKGGTWLLNPTDITVDDTGNPNTVAPDTVATALNFGTNVTLSTSGDGSQAGDITVSGAIKKTDGADASLDLYAHNNIAINADISSTAGKLNLNLNPDSDTSGAGGTTLASDATLSLNGGTVNFSGTTDLKGTIKSSRLIKSNGLEIMADQAHFSGVTIASNLVTSGTLYVADGLSLLYGRRVLIRGDWLLASGEQAISIVEGLASNPSTTPTSVWWDFIGRDLNISSPSFTHVGSGTFSGNEAVVAPGSSLNLQFNWEFGRATSSFDYCPGCVIQNYIAWVPPAQSENGSAGFFSGVVASPSDATSGSFQWSTKAPTTLGTYYIGAGLTLDYDFQPNVSGILGGQSSDIPYGLVAPFRVTVADVSTIELDGGRIRAADGVNDAALRLGNGLRLSVADTALPPVTPNIINLAGLINEGEINLSDKLQLQVSQVLNKGLITVSGAVELGDGSSLTNDGGIRVGVGGLNTTLSVFDLVLSTASNLQLDAGGAVAVRNALSLNGGTLTGNGTIALSGAANTWSGGAVDGPTMHVNSGAQLQITSPDTKVLGATQLHNQGIINWDEGSIDISGKGARIINHDHGIFDIQGDLRVGPPQLILGSADLAFTFWNIGTLLKSSGAGTARLGDSVDNVNNFYQGVYFNNDGLVDVRSGTLQLAFGNPSWIDQRGVLNIASGATLQAAGGLINQVGGLITGSGTIDLGNETLANLGSISPGAAGAAGTLSIIGDVDLTGGMLALDLGGTSANQSDLLTVTGSAILGGILQASNLSGYTPSSADAVPIITGTRTGTSTFSTTTLPTGFTAAYDLASGEVSRLIYASESPLGSTRVFTNAAGNLDWATPLNWGGDLPGALDLALISAGFSVTHASGSNAIAALTINSGNALSITGGSLNVTGLTNVGGALSVSGSGSAVLSGPLNAATGSVTVQGGTLDLDDMASIGSLTLSAGTATINASTSTSTFQQSGGTLSGSGRLQLEGIAHAWRGGTWTGSGTTGITDGSRLMVGSFDTSSNPTVLAGRVIQVAAGGTLQVEVPVHVTSDINTIQVDAPSALAAGGLLSFSRASSATTGGPTYNGFTVSSATLNLETSGTFALDPLVTTTLSTLGSGRLNWSDQGFIQIGSGSSLQLYSPSATDLTTAGVAADLAGSFQIASSATLSSTSSDLTITPAPAANFQFAGDLVVNAGTTTLNLSSSSAAALGAVKLIHGTLTINGPANPAAAATITSFNLSGGTLLGTGALEITDSFSGDYHAVVAPGSFSSLAITQASGDLNPGSLSIGGSLSLRAVSGQLSLDRALSASAMTVRGGTGVTLGSNATLTASGSGDALVVDAGSGPFVNAAGSSAFDLTGGGRWLVYSDSPLADTLGGLSFAFKQYNKSFSDSTAVAGSGNGVLYALNPSLSASLLNVSKVYDGTVDVLLTDTNLPATGAIDGDAVLLSGIGTYTTAGISPLATPTPKDVGTTKDVVASVSIASATSSAAQGSVPVYGYSLSTPTLSSGSGVITQKSIEISDISTVSTTYGTAAPTGSVSFSGAIIGDQVSATAALVSPLTSTSGNLRVGSYRQTASSISGADAPNYDLAASFTSPTPNYTISPLTLSGGEIAAASSIYGGSLAPGVVSFSNITAGDDVAATATVNVSSLSSSGKPIAGSYTQTADTISGVDAGNYTFSGITSPTPNYTISPLTLGVAGLVANNKVYDGSTQASLNTTAATLTGLVATDSVGLTGSALFADPNVGLAKSVTISSLALNGLDAANYALASAPTTLTAQISIRPLSTWRGTVAGQWSDPVNWDALPSAANVETVIIPFGTATVNYDTTAGSTRLINLINNQSLSINSGFLTVKESITVANGAVLSLNGGSFTTAALNNSGLVNGNGALLLNGSYSEAGSGRLGTSFSRVEISQNQGDLRLTGVAANGPISLNSTLGDLNLSGAVRSNGAPITLSSAGSMTLAGGSSLVSPGGTITLSSGNHLSLQGTEFNPTTIDARGSASGGTLQLDGRTVNLTNAQLNSSGDTFGGSIRIGGVAIGDGFSLPSNVTISRSSLVADPPGLGGSISVTGSDISIYETQLNVVGLNGGAVNLGSAATGSLSLDKLTSLIGGGNAIFALIGNPVRNMASYKGGTLMVNGQVTSAPLDTTALPRLLVPKLFIFQESISPISLQKSASDATASTSETASPNQWMWLGESPLRVDLTSASWITDDSQLTPDPLQPVNIEQMGGIPLNIKPLAPDQVSATFEQSEQEAMDQTAVKLSLESDVSQAPPSVSDIQAILREVNEAMRRRLAGIRR